MNVREWLNNNSAVVTIVAVLVLCFALAFIIWNNSGSGRPGPIDVYFVDLNTNEVFVGKSDQIPPIAAPSDSGDDTNGVRAHIYACGDCPSDLAGRSADELIDGDVFIAYLERYTDEAREIITGDVTPENESDYYSATEMGQLVRAVDGSNWVSINDQGGYELMSRTGNRCGEDSMPTPCRP
ncbi:MAG: hypothetical protein WD534_09635 [Phycisphaeraceae bacterium]